MENDPRAPPYRPDSQPHSIKSFPSAFEVQRQPLYGPKTNHKREWSNDKTGDSMQGDVEVRTKDAVTGVAHLGDEQAREESEQMVQDQAAGISRFTLT